MSCFVCASPPPDDEMTVPAKPTASPLHAQKNPAETSPGSTPAKGAPIAVARGLNFDGVKDKIGGGYAGFAHVPASLQGDWEPGAGTVGLAAYEVYAEHIGERHAGAFKPACDDCFTALRHLRGESLGRAIPSLPAAAVGQLSIQQVLAGLTEFGEGQLEGLTGEQINFALPTSSAEDLDEVVPRLSKDQIAALEGPALDLSLQRLAPPQIHHILPKLTGSQLEQLSKPLGERAYAAGAHGVEKVRVPTPGLVLDSFSTEPSSAEMRKRGFVFPTPNYPKGNTGSPHVSFFDGTVVPRALDYKGAGGGRGLKPLRALGGAVRAVAILPFRAAMLPLKVARPVVAAPLRVARPVVALPLKAAGAAVALPARGAKVALGIPVAAARGTAAAVGGDGGRGVRLAAGGAALAALMASRAVGGAPRGWKKDGRSGQWFYRVRMDETLSEIEYKYRRHWRRVAAQNRELLSTPEWIYPGDKLWCDKF